jgi:hypothetical protein
LGLRLRVYESSCDESVLPRIFLRVWVYYLGLRLRDYESLCYESVLPRIVLRVRGLLFGFKA